MTFQPVVPSNGIVGWKFLQSTYDSQFEAFSESTVLQREGDYFMENIGNVQTAEDLIKDRRLLEVALGAFGLDDQIDMKAMVQKVLEDGSSADDALANRLGDDRWVSFTEAFGFGPGETVKTGSIEDMENVVYTNVVQSFEAAVGAEDESMRIALYAEREVKILAEDDTSANTKWYNVMGQPALRQMFETALNLPSSFSQLDIDKQLELFKDRANRTFGSDDISIFTDPKNMEKLTNTYLARAQIAEFEASNSPASTALMLLSQ